MKTNLVVRRACLTLLATFIALPAMAQTRSTKPAKTPSKTAVKQAMSTSDGTMNLILKSGLELNGTPVELEKLSMTSLIGDVAIPVHTIAGIRFPQKSGETATVILHNGDSITGDLQVGQLKFVSQWGEASVNTSELIAVVFRKDLKWSSAATLAGNRWTLTKAVPAPTGTTTPRAGQQPNPTFRNF